MENPATRLAPAPERLAWICSEAIRTQSRTLALEPIILTPLRTANPRPLDRPTSQRPQVPPTPQSNTLQCGR